MGSRVRSYTCQATTTAWICVAPTASTRASKKATKPEGCRNSAEKLPEDEAGMTSENRQRIGRLLPETPDLRRDGECALGPFLYNSCRGSHPSRHDLLTTAQRPAERRAGKG